MKCCFGGEYSECGLNLFFNNGFMEKMENLFEVRKTVRFELKPSQKTLEWLNREKIFESPQNIFFKNKKQEKWDNYSKKIFENELKDFLEKTWNYFNLVENIFIVFENKTYSLWEIFIKRDLLEILDKNWYKNLKPKPRQISSFLELSNISNFWKNFHNYKDLLRYEFKKEYNELLELETINTVYSKNEIKRRLKKLCLVLIRTSNLLNNFIYNNENFSKKFKNNFIELESYKYYINEVKDYYWYTENESSWTLVRKFWFNAKSLRRRIPEEIKVKLEEKNKNYENSSKERDQLQKQYNDLVNGNEEENIKWKKEIYKDKYKVFVNLLNPEIYNSNFLDEKNEDTKKEIRKQIHTKFQDKDKWRYYKEQFDNLYKIVDKENIKNILVCYLENILKIKDLSEIQNQEALRILWNKLLNLIIKNDDEVKELDKKITPYKRDCWNLKVEIRNLEKEKDNLEALTHYWKLLKRKIEWEEFYYLVLTPIDNKNKFQFIDLEHQENWEFEILSYSSLQFWALEKLCLAQDWTMWLFWNKEAQINESDIKVPKYMKDIWLKYKKNW